MKEVKKVEKTWDAVWKSSKKISKDLKNEKMELLCSFKDCKGLKTLEVGCGIAEDSLYLALNGAKPTLVDVSKEALKKARENFKSFKLNAKIVRADGFSLPFKDNSFDLVFNTGVIEHFRNPDGIVKEMARVCRKKGTVCIFVPQTFNLYSIKKRALMVLGKWKLGWETNYSYPALKRIMQRQGLKAVKAFGTGSFLESFKQSGKGIFGRPLIPRLVFKALEKPRKDSWFRVNTGLDIGVIAVKE